jgi:hypothetical protein
MVSPQSRCSFYWGDVHAFAGLPQGGINSMIRKSGVRFSEKIMLGQWCGGLHQARGLARRVGAAAIGLSGQGCLG